MKSIKSIPGLKGKTVLVRVDYNVPIKEVKNGKKVLYKILDTRRIESSFKTIDFLLKKKAKVVLIAHLGKGEESLQPVALYLKKYYDMLFITDDIASNSCKDAITNAQQSTVILLENIRRYPGEEKNSTSFAKALASLGDIYVNDGFSVSHRAHASIVGIAKLLPPYAGFQLETEAKELSKVLGIVKRPFLFLLGGAKFETKVPLIRRFIKTADEVVIGGAILNSFYKVSGFEVGKSVVDDGFDGQIKRLLTEKNLLLPVDVVVIRGLKTRTVLPYEVEVNDVIVDIGPQSIDLLQKKISKAKLVVWNGPLGWYEKGFTKATVAIAKVIATSPVHAIIGGGDTGAVIEKIAKNKKNIFVSTGGGATLDFLATGTLPGIEALR